VGGTYQAGSTAAEIFSISFFLVIQTDSISTAAALIFEDTTEYSIWEDFCYVTYISNFPLFKLK
jgi:hypothetical protein